MPPKAINRDNDLRMLYAKRDMLFSRIQVMSDSSKNIYDEETKESFLCSMETVDDIRIDFEKTLDKINTFELEVNPDFVVNYQNLSSFEDLFCRVKRAAKLLEMSAKSEEKLNIQQPLKRDRPKLPPIQIPEFNGDIRNWPLFYNSFENTIHKNEILTDHEKLHYLVNKLTGKAKSVYAGITLCAENYELILNILKVKYEDKRLVTSAYLDQIFDLKNVASCNENNLEKFLDIFASSVRAIKNLKVKDLSDFLFLYIGLKKLDPETVRLFEMDRRGDKQLPTFDELETFIRDHIKILQRTSVPKHEATKKIYSDRRMDVVSKPLKTTQTYVNIASQSVCSLCHAHHEHIYKCSSFLKLTPNERYRFVRANNLCINCLSEGHRVSLCNSNSSCRRCQNKHHTLLHFDNNTAASNVSRVGLSRGGNGSSESNSTPGRFYAVAQPPPATTLLPSTAEAKADIACAHAAAAHTDHSNHVALCSLSSSRTPTTVLLATARVIVVDAYGKAHSVRALLDSASQSNFVTLEFCQRLGLDISNRSVCTVVKGIGGSVKAIQGSVKIQFHSRFDSKISFDMDSLVVDKVTERMPTMLVNTSMLSNFGDLPLADDTYAIPGDIEMLVGASIFPHLLLSRKVHGHPSQTAPHALETVLGFVIIGTAPARVDSYSTMSYCCAVGSLESTIRKFWEIEEVNCPPILSPDDKVCDEFYSRTTTRDENGRYVVALPFKGDIYSLGDSYQLAEKRFYCLEKKMLASPKLKQTYDEVISEYLDKGYISPAPVETAESKDAPSYIIPHHGVIREDKFTTKLRVVLDGSAKTSTSVSLNDILYRGQNLQGNLFDIIVNFRLFSIALSADIRQMFLCIGVNECDRRFQRILYRFSPQEPLKVYEFNRVCFGLKSSPFHALRTIKQLASDEGTAYPKAKETIETSLYMDDFVYSIDSEIEAIETAAEVINLMKAGQFDLVKWTSNSGSVLNSIPPSYRLSTVKEFDEGDLQKILGLCWSPASDLFSLKICSTPPACTKRIILSCVARIWDIMGFVAPVVLYAKLLIKELWLSDCDWDDKPPDRIAHLWTRFREELPLLDQIKIPRHVGTNKDSVVTIIGFADASEKAYGGVVYFHVQNNDSLSVSLITAKSKVSPRKVVSLARLELCGILILSKLIGTIINACHNRIHINRILAFSDSTVALCWAHSSPHRWDTFVGNRVAKIQSELLPQNLYHVPGKDNPADCLSRGLTPAQILDHSLWFRGPSWTQSLPEEWPVSPFNPSTVSEPPEQKKHTLVTAAPRELSPILLLSNRLSSWSKLLRCVVYVCRFVKILPPREYIVAADLDKAELIVLRELQRNYFSTEFNSLKSNKPCSRALQVLKPFLQDGLIRVGGRLSQSNLAFEQKHPVVLPRKDHALNLLVDYYHKKNCHAGPDLLMSILRQKYWIFSARNLIRSRVHKCVPCYRLRPKATAPEMADHRSCRVVESVKPFVHTGTDYAGPFRITISRGRGIRSTKAYVCLFVCMTIRAVHIELVGDLSTSSFMAAFKRFLSRRGPVGQIYSDNGTNYVGAKRNITELHAFLRSKYYNTEFAQVLAENRIKWSLNTPTASHFGGNWESNIKALKSHLYRVIGEQILSFEELSTVLAQVEAVMNTRPLCRTLSSDPSEPLALTPAHFLNLTPLKYLPCRDVGEDRLHVLSRHDLMDKLVQSFWKRWRTDYLHTLQSRQKWNTPSTPITVGTVVILITDNTPPLHWPLGVVEEVFPGSNGITRIVRVKTATGSYLRPVVRLCPLPN